MQGLTIGSYLTKYGKSDKMTQTPEVSTVVDNILPDELKLPGGTLTKAKILEEDAPISLEEGIGAEAISLIKIPHNK